MRYKDVPDDDHVARYASSTRLQHDDAGNVIGLAPAAFELKPKDNGKLSVTWVEYYDHCGPPFAHDAVRAFRKSMSKLGANSAFGIAKVSEIKKEMKIFGCPARVLQDPDENNPGHAIIAGYTNDDCEIIEMLASSIFSDLFLNSEVPEENLKSQNLYQKK